MRSENVLASSLGPIPGTLKPTAEGPRCPAVDAPCFGSGLPGHLLVTKAVLGKEELQALAKEERCCKEHSKRTVFHQSVRAPRSPMATPAADAQLDSYEKVAILAAKDAGATAPVPFMQCTALMG